MGHNVPNYGFKFDGSFHKPVNWIPIKFTRLVVSSLQTLPICHDRFYLDAWRSPRKIDTKHLLFGLQTFFFFHSFLCAHFERTDCFLSLIYVEVTTVFPACWNFVAQTVSHYRVFHLFKYWSLVSIANNTFFVTRRFVQGLQSCLKFLPVVLKSLGGSWNQGMCCVYKSTASNILSVFFFSFGYFNFCFKYFLLLRSS